MQDLPVVQTGGEMTLRKLFGGMTYGEIPTTAAVEVNRICRSFAQK